MKHLFLEGNEKHKKVSGAEHKKLSLPAADPHSQIQIQMEIEIDSWENVGSRKAEQVHGNELRVKKGLYG